MSKITDAEVKTFLASFSTELNSVGLTPEQNTSVNALVSSQVKKFINEQQ